MNLLNKIHLADCMDIMAQLPDKSIDLVIVDPPYGIGAAKEICKTKKEKTKFGWNIKESGYKTKNWDNEIPDKEYFKELFRVSKNQIIWGANYFGLKGGAIFWDKGVSDNFSSSAGEIAFVSSHNKIRKFKYNWCGFVKGDNGNAREKRIHPTQKPVALYNWLLQNYAQSWNTILDTHSGSGSCAIACLENNMNFIACEIDADYHKASLERIQPYLDQGKLFEKAG